MQALLVEGTETFRGAIDMPEVMGHHMCGKRTDQDLGNPGSDKLATGDQHEKFILNFSTETD